MKLFSFRKLSHTHLHGLNLFFVFSAGVSIIFLLCCHLPATDCHLASALGGTGHKRIMFGRHIIFCEYGTHDGSSPPLLNHVRISRGPTVPSSTSDEETSKQARLQFLKSPSLQHKLLRHLSQFPDGYVAGRGSRIRNKVAHDMILGAVADSRPNLSPKPKSTLGIHQDDYEGDVAVVDDENDVHIVNNESPTFTPYISARVLSNIPKFFDHIRENLKALHQEHLAPSSTEIHIEEFLNRKEKLSRNKHNEASKEQEHAAIRSRGGQEEEPHIRNPKNYDPSWLLTNLGLGKRSTSEKKLISSK